MEQPYRTKTQALIDRIKIKDADLAKEVESKLKDASLFEKVRSFETMDITLADVRIVQPRVDAERRRREESIVLANYRPVLMIRNNRIVPEFSGPNVSVWKDRLMEKQLILNTVIPSIGRVEVRNNAVYKWVGTGWLVDTDIIVTNRHVASKFCQDRDGFSFKVGYPSGFQSANMDFLEEHQNTTSLEFDVESVLWMADNQKNTPDIAFMRVKQTSRGHVLPKVIALAEAVYEGDVVVTIGYPARDPSIPDQELVLETFGDVYDKKRLAPGEVIKVGLVEIEHDCSTLGGNSGSPLIRLSTGEAVGLHFAGLYMESNFAVPAPIVRNLLNKVKQGSLPRMRKREDVANKPVNGSPGNVSSPVTTTGKYTFEANIPIRVTIEIGNAQYNTSASSAGGVIKKDVTFEEALEIARQELTGYEGIISVDDGYRFKEGWITDEKVIAVEVYEKLSIPELKSSGREVIRPDYFGYGVDVRPASVKDQLAMQGIEIGIRGLEAVPVAGVYKEPPHLSLQPIDEEVEALFHVSPDSGYPNLRDFLDRVERTLTATMYEWEAPHISDKIVEVISPAGRNLKMVTQIQGTKDAVLEMKRRLKRKFEHTWASVGAGKIVPKAYHIKVASRDGEEFWLSSGNWKGSGQPDIDPASENSRFITPLRNNNREWHVIIKNQTLAKLFEDYIHWDFEEAERVPFEEGIAVAPIFLFVPEIAFVQEEARAVGRYFMPLTVKRKLKIFPLLTPDRNSRGQRLFIKAATDLVAAAVSTIDIENQSFDLLDDNDPQFEKFFNTLLRKQDEGINVRVIFRDPREFPGDGEATLQKKLGRIKKFGFDTDNFKVQVGCHTKGIIVDSAIDRDAAVLFGSHNLTNSGCLFNRDASLLVRDAEVARYFQQIFDFDWDVLAKQRIEESVGGILSEKQKVKTIKMNAVLLRVIVL